MNPISDGPALASKEGAAVAGGTSCRAEQAQPADVFAPELATADLDLCRFADRLVQAGTRRVSFCCYGPPGTGKSALVRWPGAAQLRPVRPGGVLRATVAVVHTARPSGLWPRILLLHPGAQQLARDVVPPRQLVGADPTFVMSAAK